MVYTMYIIHIQSGTIFTFRAPAQLHPNTIRIDVFNHAMLYWNFCLIVFGPFECTFKFTYILINHPSFNRFIFSRSPVFKLQKCKPIHPFRMMHRITRKCFAHSWCAWLLVSNVCVFVRVHFWRWWWILE